MGRKKIENLYEKGLTWVCPIPACKQTHKNSVPLTAKPTCSGYPHKHTERNMELAKNV